MSIVWSGKAFAGVINDQTNTYYTDPELNGRLGQAEKYLVELKGSNIQGSPTATVSLEGSNDGVNWIIRNSTVISGGAVSTTPIWGIDNGSTGVVVGGRFARFGIKLAVASTSAYIELWVTGRTAV